MKQNIFLIILILYASNLFATHNRAGEITYEHISGYKYKITIYTYTYTLSDADRDSLEVSWGDKTTSYIQRDNWTNLPDYYKKNVYVGYHTYPGPGTFEIVMEDPNRNEGVLNIPYSVNVKFALKTVLQINPVIGPNSTPILLNMPIDRAAVNNIFVHNPAAYDPDGDSLSYKMAVCLYQGGEPIPEYTLPEASTYIKVDPVTGDLIWDSPTIIGKFNVAMEIEEWRNGIKISSIIRDIQIDVLDSDNHPPNISPLPNICVIADSLIEFNVFAEDIDNEKVTLSAVGGVFELDNSPAVFKTLSGRPSIESMFTWQTNCEHIRLQPYTVIFRAEDDNPELKLVDYENVDILVIAPPPVIETIEPSNSSIFLRWQRNGCTNASGYLIYRTNTLDDLKFDACETGMPDESMYELVGRTESSIDTTFNDTNDGLGLNQGFKYCYRIVAYFDDGAQSIPSDKACAELKRGVPIFTKVSVNHTDTENGSIFIQWMKPIDIDPETTPPPYKYSLFPSRDIVGGIYTDPFEINDINDTTFLDTLIDTKSSGSIYKLIISNYDSENNDWNPIGAASVASSIYLKLYNTDRKIILSMQNNVPWVNDTFIIYRQDPGELEFDSIGYSLEPSFTDTELENNKKYCYYVKSSGYYTAEGFPDNIINYSQINCGTPIDTVPPCPVELQVKSECDELYNYLSWNEPADSCGNDILEYYIYYANQLDKELTLIETIKDPEIQEFYHYPEKTLAACYQIMALDSAGNLSSGGTKICVDECSFYELPNVFTPNADTYNDLYHPLEYQFVEKVDMKIYNRWGNLVFETQNPDINWDGRDMTSGNLVSAGIYYYICEVYEYRLTGIEGRNLTGFIHVFGEDKTSKP